MHWKDYSNEITEFAKLPRHIGERRPIDKPWAVEGHQEKLSGLQFELTKDRRLPCAREDLDERVDHCVSDKVNARPLDALTQEVVLSLGTVDQATVRDLVDEHPIQLLRHVAIEAPKTCFEMGNRDSELGRRQARCQRRVDVAGDDHERRTLAKKDLLDPLERQPCLLTVRTGTDPEEVVWYAQLKVVKQYVRHFAVVVLPRVDDEVPQCRSATPHLAHQRSHLHEVWSGADHVDDGGARG